MSENKMIFVSVFNDGVLELAENHLISLKKSNITNYINFDGVLVCYLDYTPRN